MGYPLTLLYYRKWLSSRQVSNIKPDDVEALWVSPSGRPLIKEVLRHGLASEMALFLSATDNAADHMSRKTLIRVFDKFIRSGAPFEVNVPATLREQWMISLQYATYTPEGALQIVQQTRGTVFFLILNNYGYQINQQLEQQKTPTGPELVI
eukprot:TRINITY_DN18182_c0_g1_i2.p1 TRINITY_DN18182_c0_g1~~TRINITY_DN18182_c0_g1_i2.p1  ORF type:complete len:174 (-),score=43.33 TRINITY_DN18182_c0_g1_i2:134-589(-)